MMRITDIYFRHCIECNEIYGCKSSEDHCLACKNCINGQMPDTIAVKINALHTTGQCLKCFNNHMLIKKLEKIETFVDRLLVVSYQKKYKRIKIGRRIRIIGKT